MAVFKVSITSYRTPAGRACRKGTPGAKRVRKKSRKWYGQYRDADGEKRRVPLCTDKVAAEQMLSDIVRNVERGEVGLVNPYAEHHARPLSEHLDDYRKYLESKDDTERHVRETTGQIKVILEGCSFQEIRDLEIEKTRGFLKLRRTQGMSIGRSNHYVRALKGFTRWLEPNRVARDPFRELKTLNADKDRRLVRRALPFTVFEKLIQAAGSSQQIVCGLTGFARGMLYVVAAYTGWRASELSSLTPDSFDFEENP